MKLERRSFLSTAIAASPLALIGQTSAPASAKAVRLTRGEDWLGEHHTIGVSTTDFKVLTTDSHGGLFVMEHTSPKKGPRGVPHVWAFVGDTPGRLLITFTPANKMEAFFRDNAKRRKDGECINDAEVYRAFGLELLGPPLSI